MIFAIFFLLLSFRGTLKAQTRNPDIDLVLVSGFRIAAARRPE
jgi:hypothetical protein